MSKINDKSLGRGVQDTANKSNQKRGNAPFKNKVKAKPKFMKAMSDGKNMPKVPSIKAQK